jgi:hypothetical protein
VNHCDEVHLAQVRHDGSGTVIIGIDVVRCLGPRECAMYPASSVMMSAGMAATVTLTIRDGEHRRRAL